MKPADLVWLVFNGEEPPKVPYSTSFMSWEAEDAFLPPALMRAGGAGMGTRVSLSYDSDLYKESILYITRFLESDMAWIPGGMALMPGGETIVECRDYVIGRSKYGGVSFVRRSPYFSKQLSPAVRWPEDLAKLEPLNLEEAKPKVQQLGKLVRWLQDRGYFVQPWASLGPFDAAVDLRGYAPFLMDLIRDPLFAKKLIDFAAKPHVELGKMIVEETHVDGYVFGTDYGMTERLFFSPKIYREMFYPWDKKAAEACHRAGVPAIFHSHGNINAIFKDLIDAGYDAINPFDPGDGMNLVEIKERFGDEVVLYGGITKFINLMSRDEIRNHIEDRIGIGAPGGGFILGTAGGIPHDMKWENYVYFNRVIQRLRKYPKKIA